VVHFSAAALYLWHASLSIRASKACPATYIRSARAHELLPHILPALMLGQVADAFGQLMSYAFGAGNAAQRMVSFELSRCQHDVTENPKRRP
jgi:hypothetical protein